MKTPIPNVYDRQLVNDGRILHHLGVMLARDEHNVARPAPVPAARCAWCDAQSGRKPDPSRQESHGICTKHLAQMNADLEAQRRMAA